MNTTFEQLSDTQQRVALALLELENQEGTKFRARYEAENLTTGEKFHGTGEFILPASLETDNTFEYRSNRCYYVIPKQEIQWIK
jgi:hypothetical protein